LLRAAFLRNSISMAARTSVFNAISNSARSVPLGVVRS
jgi:hypothetical protein